MKDLTKPRRRVDSGEDRQELLALIKPTVGSLVFRAFETVDRKLFVPDSWTDFANTDVVIPLKAEEGESSISQPTLVALMLDRLELTGQERILEIGTASGWSSALLSRCASHVDTIELDSKLAAEATKRLSSLGYSNVTVHTGDGSKGLPDKAPFDGIVVTAAAREIPEDLIRQLNTGGKIIVPVGNPGEMQSLLVGKKEREGLVVEKVGGVRFVPLRS